MEPFRITLWYGLHHIELYSLSGNYLIWDDNIANKLGIMTSQYHKICKKYGGRVYDYSGPMTLFYDKSGAIAAIEELTGYFVMKKLVE